MGLHPAAPSSRIRIEYSIALQNLIYCNIGSSESIDRKKEFFRGCVDDIIGGRGAVVMNTSVNVVTSTPTRSECVSLSLSRLS